MVSILRDERLVRSGGLQTNTNWNGEKPFNAPDAKVFIA